MVLILVYRLGYINQKVPFREKIAILSSKKIPIERERVNVRKIKTC